MAKTSSKQERRLLAARARHATRNAGNAARTPSSEITEMGAGSAIRALVKLATRGKKPKYAPKKSSVEDKMKYAADRRKAYEDARARAKARADKKKDKRLTKYRTKQDAVRKRTESRVKKREDKNRARKIEREWMREDEARIARNAEMRRRNPEYQARKKQSQFKQTSTRVRDKDGNWGWR